MIIKPQNLTGHIPPGNYKGYILEQRPSVDNRYLWLKIQPENQNIILNITIPCASVVFNDFALDFANDKGIVNTEDFIDTMVEFTLKDYEVNGTIYSRFSALKAILEDDEE